MTYARSASTRSSARASDRACVEPNTTASATASASRVDHQRQPPGCTPRRIQTARVRLGDCAIGAVRIRSVDNHVIGHYLGQPTVRGPGEETMIQGPGEFERRAPHVYALGAGGSDAGTHTKRSRSDLGRDPLEAGSVNGIAKLELGDS